VDMTRPRIDELVRILNRSFDDSSHSLLANLATVTEKEWDVLPQGARRSIRKMTAHVGWAKYIYANHSFHDASMGYTDPPANPPEERLATPATATEWLREAHAYLIEAIDELPDDAELKQSRKVHWGGRWFPHCSLSTRCTSTMSTTQVRSTRREPCCRTMTSS